MGLKFGSRRLSSSHFGPEVLANCQCIGLPSNPKMAKVCAERKVLTKAYWSIKVSDFETAISHFWPPRTPQGKSLLFRASNARPGGETQSVITITLHIFSPIRQAPNWNDRLRAVYSSCAQYCNILREPHMLRGRKSVTCAVLAHTFSTLPRASSDYTQVSAQRVATAGQNG